MARIPGILLASDSTHYQVLGYSPGDDALALKTARLLLASLYHPDRCKDGRAHEVMARVNAAHAVLSDSAARKLYDASLMSTHVKCKECGGGGFKFRQRGFAKKERSFCFGCQGDGWVRKT